MDPKVTEALLILGFILKEIHVIPRMKDIQKRYYKLAKISHPYRHCGDTAFFQELLNAYHVAGDAANKVKPDDDDQEDLVARKMFSQFQFTSVKENMKSFTIKLEKPTLAVWEKTLNMVCGPPTVVGVKNGKKFKFNDECSESDSGSVFLTLYHTSKLLVQGEGGKHSNNVHFISSHLEGLYSKVYNNMSHMLLNTSVKPKHKTPIPKPTKKLISRIHRCGKCNFAATDLALLQVHKKKQHGRSVCIETKGDNRVITTRKLE